MLRRTFLQAMMAAPAFGAMPSRTVDAELRRHRITDVTVFSHKCPRPKLVGKNSHLDVHGDSNGDTVLRLTTSKGAVGFGAGRIDKEVARQLLEHTVDELWSDELGSIGLLGRSDHALFDLVGKIRGVPAWELLGGKGRSPVPVYDGSIYFADLLPQYEKRGVERLVEEAREGRDRGFHAFKVKVGRGFKWMEKEAGFARDVEVITALRKALGPDVRLMVDANNGFDLESTKRWLDQVGDMNLYFVEEMFPEVIDHDRALKEYLSGKGWSTLVADGESAGRIDHFEPFIREGVIDVLQPDIKAFGLSLQWALSRKLVELGSKATLAPHNWGSYLGFYMLLVLARGIPNFLIAECDYSTSDLFDVSGFIWESDGTVTVPNAPGCGIGLREDVFKARYEPTAWSVRA